MLWGLLGLGLIIAAVVLAIHHQGPPDDEVLEELFRVRSVR